MRLSKKYSQTWLVLLFLLLTDLLLAQSQNFIEKLVTAIESDDTLKVTTLLKEQSQNSFAILIHYSGSNTATLQTELAESSQPFQKNMCDLPYFKFFNDISPDLEFKFIVSKNQNPQFEFPFNLKDNCKVGYLTCYIFDSKNKLKIHSFPIPQYSTRVDTVPIVEEIKMPETRYFNYKVLSSGIISLGSFIWFLSERSMAIDDFDKYNDSKNMPDVVDYRISTEKHRVKRDIAGAISTATGVAFTYFLVKDIFCHPKEKSIKKEQLHSGLKDRLQFGLIPDAFNNSLQFSMLVRF